MSGAGEHQGNGPALSLPLFPLHVTLFPRGEVPLQIFEQRYQAMLRVCLEQDRRFGVVLIASGQEVGAPAVPHLVGTVARITDVTPLPDGRFHIVVRGEQRFAIERVSIDAVGYLVGHVRPRPDNPTDEPGAVASMVEQARAMLSEMAVLALGAQALTPDLLAMIDDPLQLTALAADVVPNGHDRKQRILEHDSALERLRRMLDLMRGELTVLGLLAREPERPLERGIFSTN